MIVMEELSLQDLNERKQSMHIMMTLSYIVTILGIVLLGFLILGGIFSLINYLYNKLLIAWEISWYFIFRKDFLDWIDNKMPTRSMDGTWYTTDMVPDWRKKQLNKKGKRK